MGGLLTVPFMFISHSRNYLIPTINFNNFFKNSGHNLVASGC